MENKKTLIAVPCMDTVATPFCQSIATIQKEGDCAVSFMVGSLIYDSRNSLVRQALEIEADYILWLDSDMLFNPDLMVRLRADLDEGRDIVTGVYHRRVAPYSPILFKSLTPCEGGVKWEGFDDHPKDELFRIAGCGFGGVMMKTDVIFDIGAKYGTWFNPINNVGEDLSFCMRATELGYDIWCDPKVKLGHVGHITITDKFFEAAMGRS